MPGFAKDKYAKLMRMRIEDVVVRESISNFDAEEMKVDQEEQGLPEAACCTQ